MANKTLSDFPVLTNLDAASVVHVQNELVDYQVAFPMLAPYLAQTAISGADEKTDPVDADMVGLMDSAAAGNALKKFSWANFKAKLKTYFDALYPSANGWVTLGLTITYASADSPTFTATVPGDVTGVLSAGMKLKLTQTTAKYFIITAAPSYASGTGLTTLTLYGGTDYTLDDAAISNVYYSAMRAPYGFPMNPDKWTVEVQYTTDYAISSPSAGSWYNPGSMQLVVPIGCWTLSHDFVFLSGSPGLISFGLSTSLSSFTNLRLRGWGYAQVGAHGTTIALKDEIAHTSKQTYYFMCQADSEGISTITIYNVYHNTTLKAICAYL